eukprot:1213047-Prymnesium_polylepis.1
MGGGGARAAEEDPSTPCSPGSAAVNAAARARSHPAERQSRFDRRAVDKEVAIAENEFAPGGAGYEQTRSHWQSVVPGPESSLSPPAPQPPASHPPA